MHDKNKNKGASASEQEQAWQVWTDGGAQSGKGDAGMGAWRAQDGEERETSQEQEAGHRDRSFGSEKSWSQGPIS